VSVADLAQNQLDHLDGRRRRWPYALTPNFPNVIRAPHGAGGEYRFPFSEAYHRP
jgi:hypothetical protein